MIDWRCMSKRPFSIPSPHVLLRSSWHRFRGAAACLLTGVALTATCFAAVPPAWAAAEGVPGDPVGHWTFDKKDGGDRYVNEGSNKELKLTVSGDGAAVAASDVKLLGNSLILADKTKDFDVSVERAVDSQKAYSISMWVCSTDNNPAAKTAILQFGGEGRTLLYQKQDGKFTSFIGGSDIDLGKDSKRGSWEHVLITKTGDPKNVMLYINGSKVGSGSWTGNLPAGMMKLIIGEHKNAGDMSRFQGKIDELCIFDKALSAKEAKALYASYGDLSVADELAGDVEAAKRLLAEAGDNQTQAHRKLAAAISKAEEALKANDIEAMKAAKNELSNAVQAVRAIGVTITVDPRNVIRNIDDSLFGINHRYSNYGYGTVNPDGTVKEDFAALYKKAGFGSLRYPGGTISNNYVWTESIGDLDPKTPEIERTPQIHGFYNNPGQAGFVPAFGLLEVAEFVEKMNSEIIMVYGIGRGDASDAADMVEFLNAKKGTNPNGGVAWADKRAELGHPEPFGIRYFEIGNENNQGGGDGTTSQQYWMPNVVGGALEGYVDGGTATFGNKKQYAVVRGNWNESKSFSTGEPDQEFGCRYALIPRTDKDGARRDAVVPGSVRVYVGDELWGPTDDITKAGKNEKVYQLDVKTGFFTFGDGEHGAIPQKGKQIKVDYQVERDGFIDISKAMRETQKQINEMSGSQGKINIYTSWEANGFVDKMHEKNADELYDGMAVHPYTNKVGNPHMNDSAATVQDRTQWYLDAMRLGDAVANNVEDHVDYMRKVSGDDSKVPVISEYGIFRSTNPMVRSQAHALFIARAIMEYAEQGSPYIQKHCLVDYYSSGADSLGPTQQAVIQAVAQNNLDDQKDGTGPFKFFSTPSASIFEMLNGSFGSKMVDVELSNESTLSNGVPQHSVMASTDADGAVYVAIVNLGLNDVETAGENASLANKAILSVGGMDLTGKTIKVQTLSGASFDQENSLAHPDNVKIETSEFKATSAAPELKLAPHSFTIVTVAESAPAPGPMPEPEPEPDPEPSPQPTRHTVEFVVDGTKVASLVAVDGKLEGEVPVPEKGGWAFEGWFDESGAIFDLSKPIGRSVVLTAKWSKPLIDLGESKPVEPVRPVPSPQEKPQNKPHNDLPHTADPSSLAAVMGFAGAALAMVGARGRKRRS